MNQLFTTPSSSKLSLRLKPELSPYAEEKLLPKILANAADKKLNGLGVMNEWHIAAMKVLKGFTSCTILHGWT